jgi:MFS family permease
MSTGIERDSGISNMEQKAAPSLIDNEKRDTTADMKDEVEYATGLRLFLIMLTILMSTSLAAIEIGIIATAIPGITDTFHRLNDVGWYGSVTFLMGSAAPMWGKIYKYLDIKYAYLASIVCYLVASIIGGTARNSNAVIVGRALQGLGACGTLGGSLLVINYVARPDRRPLLIGIWMGIFMISTIIGPLIGGAFTSAVYVLLSRFFQPYTDLTKLLEMVLLY